MPTTLPPHLILGVSPTASRADIQAAWRRAAARWHPDRNPDPSASARLSEVNAARAQMLDALDRSERPAASASDFEGAFWDIFRQAASELGEALRDPVGPAGAANHQTSSAGGPSIPTIRVRIPLSRWLWGGDGSVSGPEGTTWTFHIPPGSSFPVHHRVQTSAGAWVNLVLEGEADGGYTRSGARRVRARVLLDVVDAALGRSMVLESLGGYPVRLVVPPGVQHHDILTVSLPGGVTVEAQIHLVVPKQLSPERRAALAAYRTEGADRVRSPAPKSSTSSRRSRPGKAASRTGSSRTKR